MDNPSVCCILLTADRQAQTDRAVKAFLAQTYDNKRLLVYDSGSVPLMQRDFGADIVQIRLWRSEHCPAFTIGALRNAANTQANADIIAHWDSDDWSAPTRLEEQVAHLQESKADVVGYSDMLFWDVRTVGQGNPLFNEAGRKLPGWAWLFNNGKPNYALGTSLMYWRSVWGKKPFPDTSKGCDDYLWVQGLKVDSCSGMPSFNPKIAPLMVAEIHGGNTCAQIDDTKLDWTRVPAWDSRLAEIMRLA